MTAKGGDKPRRRARWPRNRLQEGFAIRTTQNHLLVPHERGIEPDACYVLGNREVEIPDLAIEVM